MELIPLTDPFTMPEQDPDVPNRVVVRLKRSCWIDATGLHQRTDLNYLKRKSSGFNWVEEEVSMAGAELIQSIDMDKYDDGIYEIVTTNHHHDWETGTLDDYDLGLVPYEEEKNVAKR